MFRGHRSKNMYYRIDAKTKGFPKNQGGGGEDGGEGGGEWLRDVHYQ